jgi:hypothetical protein
MEIALPFFWIAFAVVVGVAAASRGRNGFGWFVLALLISPLIALLLVLVMQNRRSDNVSGGPIILERHPNLYEQDAMPIDELASAPPAQIQASSPFEPDGVYAGIPYRVLETQAVDAFMSGSLVRFRNMDHFMAAASGGTIEKN